MKSCSARNTTLRRLAVGCGALAVLAVAGFVPAAASSSATETICVGLIVDPHTIGGKVSATCVNVKEGTTGVGVLEAAGHTVTFRGDGLLCTIDALPKSGCNGVDNLHYWAYFHREPDSTTWDYSSEGGSTYEPENRETEGWVYNNGVPQMPKNIPAKDMCAGLLKSAATPTPTATKTHHAATHAHSPSATSSTAQSAAPTPTPTKTQRHGHRGTPEATPTPPDATATSDIGATPSPTAVASDTSDGSSSGNARGAIIAAAIAAVIAGATVLGARRRRR